MEKIINLTDAIVVLTKKGFVIDTEKSVNGRIFMNYSTGSVSNGRIITAHPYEIESYGKTVMCRIEGTRWFFDGYNLEGRGEFDIDFPSMEKAIQFLELL